MESYEYGSLLEIAKRHPVSFVKVAFVIKTVLGLCWGSSPLVSRSFSAHSDFAGYKGSNLKIITTNFQNNAPFSKDRTTLFSTWKSIGKV